MSAKSKSPQDDIDNESLLNADSNSDLERKIDEMMSLDVPPPAPASPKVDPKNTSLEPKKEAQIASSEPLQTPAPTAVSSEIAGAPILPVNKTSAFKKKIAIADHDDKNEQPVKVTEEKPMLPADNEIEAFEEPVAPIKEPIEEVALTETETAPRPAPDPIEVARQRVSQLPEPNDDLGLESASTSRAVDEIIAAEADELLAARDGSFENQLAEAKSKKSPKQPKKSRISKKLLFELLVLALLIGLAVIAAFPVSRNAVLNAAGVRASSSVAIFDEATGEPLKNAEFSVGSTSAKTDSEGRATVTGIRLGKHTLTLKKPAYAPYTETYNIRWGSNPLGEFKLKSVGSRYTIVVSDFQSKKPIAKAEAVSGEANASSNDEGKLTLAMPQSDSDTAEVQISADGYRTEKIKLNLSDTKEVKLEMTPARKQAFISKRSGKFDLYKIDVDGKNEEKVLAGTGNERSESIALAPHSTKEIVALVSNRESGESNSLTLVNLTDNTSTEVVKSSRIQLVNWIGDKLIYVKVGNNEAEASPTRHRLVSYDINAKSERELTSTNYFNDVITANGSIYYTPASYQVNGSVGLYKINPDGNYRKSVYDKEVWNLFRTSYDKLSVSIGQEWFELNLDNDVMNKLSAAPANQKTRTYLNSLDGKTSLWIDERDGKGVLLGYDTATKNDKVLQTQSGLKNPVRWLDSKHIVYRVSSTSEIADYLLNLEGGEPKKIRDVTDTAGIDRWYYY